jgi:hypothetical protein
MKRKKLINKILTSVFMMVIFASCDGDVNDVKWGDSKVYMPQASMLNGGVTNNFPVPFTSSNIKNHEIDNNTNSLKIVLGVYRSGLKDLEAFSVKVTVNQDSTNSVVNKTIKGIALPTDTYTLPTEVSVKDGERSAVFYLTVDVNKLLTKYPSYATKKMCLVVEISEPTKYELNNSLSRTNVIITGSAFMPAPIILQDGDFGTGSELKWLTASHDGDLPAISDAVKIANGVLTMNYGTGTVTRTITVYHPVTLVKGVKYKFSASAKWTGGKSAEFYFIGSSLKPTDGVGYSKTNSVHNFFTGLDVWMAAPNFSTAGSGTFPQAGKYQGGIAQSTGEFTANFTDGYVVIIATCWGGNIGNLEIDNIKIEEL